ncbi:MAG: glycoside hydrolase family 18 protein [Phycisphaerales bacterium]
MNLNRNSLWESPRRLLVIALVIMGLGTSPSLHAEMQAADGHANRPILLAYLPAWVDSTPDQVPLDKLTHICHAFIKADTQGHLIPERAMPNRPLIDAAHKHGVKVLISVGGSESDAFLAPVAADPAKLDLFVHELIDYVKSNDYDGIDLDWEFPNSEASAQGLIRMIALLRQSIDKLEADTARDYLLTRAVGGAWAYTYIPTEVFRDNFDFLNVMCYDCTGPWAELAGHHSPLTASIEGAKHNVATAEQTLKHWRDERGLPTSMLVMGLPAYGRGFRGVEMFGTVEKNSDAHTTYTYADLDRKMAEGWTVKRMDNGAPWLVAPDGSEIVGFDDPESIRMKTRWAVGKGLAGVFFWEATQDRLTDNTHPLIEAAAEIIESTEPSRETQ